MTEVVAGGERFKQLLESMIIIENNFAEMVTI